MLAASNKLPHILVWGQANAIRILIAVFHSSQTIIFGHEDLRFPPELLEFPGKFTCVGVHASGTHPSVVIVTIVYQKEAGILVNLLELDPFSA